MNSSLGDLDATQNDYEYNITSDSYVYEDGIILSDLGWNIWISISLIIYCIGFVGNGKVIWILGFHMKRNSFSIYVLNLAVADCGVIIMTVLTQISEIQNPFNFRAYFILNLLSFVFISVDRCVSVLFPIWHQCHRPPKLSLIVCAVTWVLPLVYFVLELAVLFQDHFLLFQLIFNGLISYPLMVISSLILLVKIFFKQHQQKRKRVLTVTLLALMCFIVFQYNMMADIFLAIIYSTHPWFQHIFILALVSDICIAVNSSINPILYFLAGRNKDDQSRVSIKLALHRVFRNEEDTKENEMQPDKTSL
uniref:G-protein coupled receptors family 1 profile domain-containing protein n=1 Tax=Pseudonaja textilis TaxID=8673 RepID=A0A670YTB7_PSETE